MQFLQLLRRLPFALALALAFGWMIDVSLFMPDSLSQGLALIKYPHLIVTALGFAAVAVFHRRLDMLLLNAPARVVYCSIICLLCMAAIGASCFVNVTLPNALLVLLGVIVALYQAIVIGLCLKRLAQLPMVDCMVLLAVWQLFVALLRALSVAVSSMLVSIAAPVIIAICLLKTPDAQQGQSPSEAKQDPEDKTSAWVPVRLLLINMVVIFTIQALQGISQGPVANLSYIGSFIAIAIVGLTLAASKKPIRMQHLYRTSLAGLELAIIVFALGTIAAQWVSTIMLDAVYSLFSIFFITTLCNACQRNNERSLRIFAVAYLLEQIAALMGSTAAVLVGDGMQAFVLTLLAGLGAIAFLCLATDDDFLTAWNTARHKTNFVDPVRYYYSLSEICSSIAMQYSLSPREGEVLLLLAQRKTAVQISEELVVSAATVKTHVHHIYQKLGIHTKQELFEFLNI